MVFRASHWAALGLSYSLVISCSSDDDSTPPAGGSGNTSSAAGENAGGEEPGFAGQASGGTSGSGGSAAGQAGSREVQAGAGGAGGAESSGGVPTSGGDAGGAGGAAPFEYDFTCSYPLGTPCDQSVPGNSEVVGQLTSEGEEIVPGTVYVVWLDAQGDENVDLKVCGDAACSGDQQCESAGPADAEECIVQAGEDALSVYVKNLSSAAATVKVDMNAETMFEFKLAYAQSSSSLAANGYQILWVTGLTPATTYELSVTTTNQRPVNLLATKDLHGAQVLCDEDLEGTAATCELTPTQSAVWARLTDTSGMGDGFVFKVTAK